MSYFPHRSVCIISPGSVSLPDTGLYGDLESFASIHVIQSGFGNHMSTLSPSTRSECMRFYKPAYLIWLKHLCHTSQGIVDVFALCSISWFSIFDVDKELSLKGILYSLFVSFLSFTMVVPFVEYRFILLYQASCHHSCSSQHPIENKLFLLFGT